MHLGQFTRAGSLRSRALMTVEQAIGLTEAVLPRLARLAAQPGPRRLDARDAGRGRGPPGTAARPAEAPVDPWSGRPQGDVAAGPTSSAPARSPATPRPCLARLVGPDLTGRADELLALAEF